MIHDESNYIKSKPTKNMCIKDSKYTKLLRMIMFGLQPLSGFLFLPFYVPNFL